ncbi:helix-turn-helix transcriptional regulator [Antrihabitans sp. NCIMB 15449]|uniref:Helix-turn-helix transcriptional regulator n=1 Tax=Antrihabitans spumae TaxID=3373370 RepID=A0ABW7JKD0_9NOCA
MRSSRLVEMMLRLQGSRRTTAAALAEDLGVSLRTVYRDIADLSAAGVPLWTETGRNGGIRLLDGWQSKLSGLTGAETSALMLLGVPALADDLGLGSVAASAESKLLGALPLPLRIGAEQWRDRLHVDTPGWFRRPRTPDPQLPTVADAVLQGRRLRMDYRGSQRTVDPLGLVAKAAVWYLVARSRGRILSYRTSRITAAVVLADAFDRPDGFDLVAWWEHAEAEFDRSLLRFAATLRLSPTAWRDIAHHIGTEAARVTPSAPDESGWVTVELLLESEEVALGQLTALGAGVEVVAPQSLRRRLGAVGVAMAARNG